MSDNIPFEIQMEIIKRLPVKPLIQFRSVSKPWKAFIDSSQFITGYDARHTQPHSRILMYKVHLEDLAHHISFVDDNIQILHVLPSVVVSPLLKQYHVTYVVGACHGLLCLSCYNKDTYRKMVVIWNPSIGKSFGIALPSFFSKSPAYSQDSFVLGFGVCPVTRDPTIVKIMDSVNRHWHVEVFTLSSGVWNVIPSSNLPSQTVRLNPATQVVIDRFIYWGAAEKTFDDNGEATIYHMVLSFDLITKEFKVVDLPDTLTKEIYTHSFVSVCKLRGSLVLSGLIKVEGAFCCVVWMMEHDSSFRKLFLIGAPLHNILGFSKCGEPVSESLEDEDFEDPAILEVYDPCSQQTKNLEISGVRCSFFMDSYEESLLLLDHPDLHIYYNDN